jgi:flagellar basal-body rod modification protein FlgD
MVEISPYSALSNLGRSSTDRASIGEDFDTFLSLLTTQLKNQSPLDPMDTTQFTQQLVQFTEVEQTVKQNESLEKLIQLSAANTITNVVGFLGGAVTLAGDTAEFKNGAASWNFNLAQAADNATVTISDSNGVPVFTSSGPTPEGNNTFVWDGATTSGVPAPDGDYTISISAVDSSGTAIEVKTEIVGIVDGINFDGNEPKLMIGNHQFGLNEITSVKLPNVPTTTSDT